MRLLRKLCTAVAVSGEESEVRRIVLDELKPKAQDYKVDALGNVLITRKGRGGRRLRVMLDAHMDEVGFMLVADSGDGVYEFKIIGGIDAGAVAGKAIVVGEKHTPGVVGAKAIHLARDEELKRPIAEGSLRIDLGPGGKAAVGDRGTFAPNYHRSGPAILSKSLDDRLGVATLIELVRHAPPNVDVLAAFTVQEEIGLRGAEVAAHYFKPDIAIVIDATPARDLPMQREGENNFYNTKLGFGPAIYAADSSTIHDRRLIAFLKEIATRAKIPHQIRQPEGGGTDAGAIQRAVDGVPVATVSVPHRYPHTSMSIARVDDWQNTLTLLSTALRKMTTDVLKRNR
jgi:endoglucanase